MRRPTTVLLLLVLVSGPPALTVASAGAPSFTLVAARMDSIFDLEEQLGATGSHHRLEFTVRNDGATGADLLAIDAWWIVVDLATTVWSEAPALAAGETRTFVADGFTGGLWFPPGPMWMCLRAGDNGGHPTRCWSLIVGAPTPEGAYPENLPHWQLADTPMGDTP